MTSSSMPKIFAATAAAALLLSGCASGRSTELDTGQRMSARGDSIAGRGAAWSDGQRDMQKGQKALDKSAKRTADAQRDLQRAQGDITKAQRKIEDEAAARVAAEQLMANGTAQMSRAEADYGAIRSQPSVLPQ